MDVAVIGCGWLGYPLALRLKDLGHTVLGSSTRETQLELLENKGISGFLYDDLEHSNLSERVKKSAVAIINFPPSRSRDYAAQVKHLIAQFSSDTKVIFTSSTGVYQDLDGTCDESSPVLDAHPVYLAEAVVRQSGRNATILRLAGLISEDRNPVKYLSGKLNADGQKVVNLVHREDVISALLKVLENEVWGETFNVCFPDHPTRKDYYCKQAALFQIQAPTFSFSIGKGKEIDPSKLVRTLGFAYTHSL